VALPELPWYRTLRRVVAPTEAAADVTLAILALVTLLVLWRGDPLVKAAWAVYLVSP
jgi:hypothetical protein